MLLTILIVISNEMLPRYLPIDKGNAKVRELVSQRLVRHYTAIGMLDGPHKLCREPRYSYRHLLQLLVVRRMLSEGYGAKAIGNLARSNDNAGLEALLRGGAKLEVTIANPALAYLDDIQHRISMNSPLKKSYALKLQKQPVKASTATQWTRVEVTPGLEINISNGFSPPKSPEELQTLQKYITRILEDFLKERRTQK
jgi:DNA-binding transcriptional MerR regulator